MRWLPRPAKDALKLAGIVLLNARERLAVERQQALLVMAHMRSGSTLLHHLLISHPQIIGRGERNEVFANSRDLDRLKLDVHLHQGRLFRVHRFVADQINHDRFLTSEALLNHPHVRPIFLIREPQASIASMVRVLGRHYGTTVEQATEYYADRLKTLTRYAGQIADPSQAFFLTYGDLVLNTEATLRELQSFLGLSTPLTEEYQVFDFTGSRGDPSPQIRSGRIQRQPEGHHIDPTEESQMLGQRRGRQSALDLIHRNTLAQLLEAYQNCQAAMRSACSSISDQ